MSKIFLRELFLLLPKYTLLTLLSPKNTIYQLFMVLIIKIKIINVVFWQYNLKIKNEVQWSRKNYDFIKNIVK